MPEDQWWGYSRKHGWVVLDRTIPCNKPGQAMRLVFTRCKDWIEFYEERTNWNLPQYIYAPNYIKKLSGDAAIQANQQYLKLRDEWTSRNEQINFIKKLVSDFEKISCFSHYKIMWEHSSYLRISENDIKLAKLWLSNSEKNFTYHQAKMLSARFAEKIAMEFYQSIGYEVKDISITQLTRESEDWKLYDILLNDQIAIDVKNSRNPVSSQTRYVEYCIPRFKETRYGDQIKIAGVMSPYLTLEYLYEPLKTYFPVRPIIYLGETTKQNINEILERFNTKNLQIRLDDKSILPPWIFSYPDRYYQKRNIQINYLKSLIDKNNDESNFILNQLSKKLLMEPYDIIPIIVAMQIKKKELSIIKLENLINNWEMEFCDNIISQPEITMPAIFLSLLSHFIKMIKSKDILYSPIKYKNLLFFKEDKDFMFPLGIADPLNIIISIIETLETVWIYKISIENLDFEIFKFQGLGLLQGKKHSSDKFETIIAYCGGFIDQKGKCGNTPLIVGREKTCKSCGKLICPKCNYCSNNCQNMITTQHPRARSVG